VMGLRVVGSEIIEGPVCLRTEARLRLMSVTVVLLNIRVSCMPLYFEQEQMGTKISSESDSFSQQLYICTSE